VNIATGIYGDFRGGGVAALAGSAVGMMVSMYRWATMAQRDADAAWLVAAPPTVSAAAAARGVRHRPPSNR
jgi:hypothetical protein